MLTGKPRPAEDVIEPLRSAFPSIVQTERSWRFHYGDSSVAMGGLESGATRCGRIWFGPMQDSEALCEQIMKIAQSLDWKLELRWCIRRNGAVLPPSLDELRNRRRATIRVGPQQFRLGIYAATVLLLLYTMTIAVQTLPWHRATLRGLFICGVAGLPFLCWIHLRRPTAFDKPAEYWTSVNIILCIWFAFGGPGRTGANVYMAVTLPIFGFSFLLFRRWVMQPKFQLRNATEWHRLVAGLQRDEFLNLAATGRCLVCEYNLRDLPTCRCPECGTQNYYLVERPDARPLANKNGAILEQ